MLESQDDVRVVAEADSGQEALDLVRRYHPDVALVDGLEPAESLHRACPDLAVLVLSMYNDERYVARALGAGVKGYVLKQTVEEDLPLAIERVRTGGKYLSPGVKQ